MYALFKGLKGWLTSHALDIAKRPSDSVTMESQTIAVARDLDEQPGCWEIQSWWRQDPQLHSMKIEWLATLSGTCSTNVRAEVKLKLDFRWPDTHLRPNPNGQNSMSCRMLLDAIHRSRRPFAIACRDLGREFQFVYPPPFRLSDRFPLCHLVSAVLLP